MLRRLIEHYTTFKSPSKRTANKYKMICICKFLDCMKRAKLFKECNLRAIKFRGNKLTKESLWSKQNGN